ncbi:MAG: hypothetical protein QXG52_06140 [Candidatus Caldarchaeum sp.]
MEITRGNGQLKYSLSESEITYMKKFYADYGLNMRKSDRVFNKQSAFFYAYDSAHILHDIIAESDLDLDPQFYIDDINRPLYEIAEDRPYGFVVNLAIFRIISPMPYFVYTKVPTTAFTLLVKAAQVIYDEVFDYAVAKISFNITRVK